MVSIRQIAQDPHKALRNLEKELGVEPDALLRDMARLAGKGDNWKSHLPYLIAECYYEDEAARAEYQGHVDSCEYCKALLQTLHPSDPQVRDFAEQATAVLKREQERALSGYLRWQTVSAMVVVFMVGTGIAVPVLQGYDVLPVPAPEKQFVVNELRLQPGKLVELENSNIPTERYRAARYYFAVEQPQLAYRQIGEGLELAGLGANDAKTITTAADVPHDSSAGNTLALAAQRVASIKSSAVQREPAQLLELAVAQAKLGYYPQSLKSIRKYLEARNVDPRLLTEFSETALAKR
jgi:hypothetical protein